MPYYQNKHRNPINCNLWGLGVAYSRKCDARVYLCKQNVYGKKTPSPQSFSTWIHACACVTHTHTHIYKGMNRYVMWTHC